MSDNATQSGAEVETQVEQIAEPEVPAAKTYDESYVKKLREEAAGYRTRLKEFEDAQKTEAQRQAERIAELEAKVKAHEAEKQIAAWAQEITKGSPVPAAALRGSTREELEAHFDQLKSLIPDKPTIPPVPTMGKQPDRAGNVPLSEQIAAAEAAGNKALVAALKAAQLGAASS